MISTIVFERQTDEDSYAPLRCIMKRFGKRGNLSPKEFYWAVNDAYHTAESAVYDTVHSDMFLEIEPIWSRLLNHVKKSQQKLSILDIGSGTGLVGQFLNKLIPDRVGLLIMLDPNEAMLDKSKIKSQNWAFPCKFIKGDLTSIVPLDISVDIVTLNSVMHHIVEIESFCALIPSILNHGGLLLQAQDPREGMRDDPVFIERRQTMRVLRVHPDKSRVYLFLRAISGKLIRLLTRNYFRLHPLAWATSQPLLKQGVIRKPMDIASIWAVTDFHVPDLPGNIGHGLNLSALKKQLDGMLLIDFFTYHFYDLPWTEFSEKEKQAEIALFIENDPHGAIFGSAWEKIGGELDIS